MKNDLHIRHLLREEGLRFKTKGRHSGKVGERNRQRGK